MERKQFTFYESFFRAVSRIKKKNDRATAYDAICAYALYGEEPNLDSLPDAAAIAFDLIKPTLDSSRRKAENGKYGGKSKQAESKPKAKRKQTAREKEGEKEKEVEVEKEVEDECPPPKPPLDLSAVPDGVRPAVAEWLAYKRERREAYKPQGLTQFLSLTAKNAGLHGCEAVSAIIRQSMASGYQGVTWDRLSRQPAAASGQAGNGFNPFLDMLREEGNT